jgi:hypothetical protein
LRGSWKNGDSGMANSCNFQRWRSCLSPNLIIRLWHFLPFTQQKLLLSSTAYIHAALGGDGPRWQPLNVAVAMYKWRDASQKGSWQAAMAIVAYNCNWMTAALLLLLRTVRGGSVVVVAFIWHWILNLCFSYSYIHIQPF